MYEHTFTSIVSKFMQNVDSLYFVKQQQYKNTTLLSSLSKRKVLRPDKSI